MVCLTLFSACGVSYGGVLIVSEWASYWASEQLDFHEYFLGVKEMF